MMYRHFSNKQRVITSSTCSAETSQVICATAPGMTGFPSRRSNSTSTIFDLTSENSSKRPVVARLTY